MKYLYILTSNDKDFYFEQTVLSVKSLKKHNQKSTVSLLMDEDTYEYVSSKKQLIEPFIDEYKAVYIPDTFTKKQKSRWLKTKMRNIIDEDFLYIDSDTIICENLDEVFAINSDIASVIDKHQKLCDHNNRREFYNLFRRMKFNYDSLNYFNGGVLFVRDNNLTRRFFTQWHSNWLNGLSIKIDIDMPSLAKTNMEFDYCIYELDGYWNCQIEQGVQYLTNAKIIHSFATKIIKNSDDMYSYRLLNKNIFIDFKKNQSFEKYDQIIANPKEGFDYLSEIISGKSLSFHYTNTFYILFYIYSKFPRFFSIFESINSSLRILFSKFK